jgi:Gram-negative bacterial TonB protein C-terminal
MRLVVALLLMHSVAPAAVRDIVTRLRHAPENGTNVSPAVSADLTALKHALRDLIADTVRNGVGVAPEELQARVIAQLAREDVPVGDVGNFGVIEDIAIERPKEYAEWLIATIELGIPWGDDASLYVFKAASGSWQLAMAVERTGYDAIYGAQGSMAYRVGLAADGNSPFLLTTSIAQSNVSVWLGLTLRVLAVGADPEHPVVLLSRTLPNCIDQPYQVALERGGFGLLNLGEAVNELLGFRGLHYVQYVVRSNGVSLVKEDAADPTGILKGCVGGAWLQHRKLQGRDVLFAVAACEKPVRYVVLRVGSSGFRVESRSTVRPEWLDDSRGETVWAAGMNDVTVAVAASTVAPRLPEGYTGNQRDLRLSLVVKSDGSIDMVSIPDWPDEPGLVVPAIRALHQWKFKPGMKDGQPATTALTVDVVFQN